MKQGATFADNTQAETKRVRWYNRESSAETIYEGQPVCYMFDTTVNITGWSKSSAAVGSSTTEGYQNEGKYLIVEKPYSDNLAHFAGVVVGGGWCGKSVAATSYEWIEIYIPNGAIVPVRCDVDTTTGKTILSIASDAQELGQCTANTRPVAIAYETETDLDSTAGITLAKLDPNMFIFQDLSDTALEVGAGTSTLVANKIHVKSANTSGDFTALWVQAESSAGAASNGYGCALYVQGDLTAAASNNWNAGGIWANVTGGTQAGIYISVFEIGLYASGATLTNADVCTLCLRNQVSATGAPNAAHSFVRFVQDGSGDSVDYLFSFYTMASVGMTASDAGASTYKIPIRVEQGAGAGGTYYLMVSDG